MDMPSSPLSRSSPSQASSSPAPSITSTTSIASATALREWHVLVAKQLDEETMSRDAEEFLLTGCDPGSPDDSFESVAQALERADALDEAADELKVNNTLSQSRIHLYDRLRHRATVVRAGVYHVSSARLLFDQFSRQSQVMVLGVAKLIGDQLLERVAHLHLATVIG